jgi:SAM-dependent methyltransferase
MNKIREIIKTFLPEPVRYTYRQLRKYRKRKNLERQYAGNKVTCVICSHNYRIFEPFKNIENEKCTNCGSMKRHRLLYKYLWDYTQIFSTTENLNLLHFAPEKAFYKIFSKNENIRYFPCDIEPDSYKFFRNTKIYKVDITEIAFKDNSFDVILCNHVLEHIVDDGSALRELYRVMKKGAWGIFQVPIDFNREKTYEDPTKTTPEERYAAFGQMDHVRWYGNDYPERLKKAGFKVSAFRYTDEFSAKEKFKYGLPEKESIYLCYKE